MSRPHTSVLSPELFVEPPLTAAGAANDAQYVLAGAVSVAIAGGGTGYTDGDVLTVVGGTGTAATLTVQETAGVVDSVVITTAGDYSVLPTNPVSVTGGTGNDDATFNLTGGVTLTLTLSGERTHGFAAVEFYSAATGLLATAVEPTAGTLTATMRSTVLPGTDAIPADQNDWTSGVLDLSTGDNSPFDFDGPITSVSVALSGITGASAAYARLRVQSQAY